MDKKNTKHLSIIVSFILVFGSLAPVLVLTAQAQKVYIPSWIKQNAGWWSEGQISDESFVQGLQYLIKEDILQIPETKAGTGTSQEIPSWIKQNAGWWSQGQIGDESFVNGIQWLVKNEIIIVETTPQEDDSNQPTTQPTVEINPVPWTRVNLVDFNQNTAEYRAYQVSGDPFRIVCMEPCTIDEQLIFAKYHGFKKAHKLTVEFMGIDVLPELAPVDIHLNDDPLCPYVPGVSTGTGRLQYHSDGRGIVCVWDVEKENRFLEFTPENAIKVRDQGLVVHEYAHVILWVRNQYSLEDIVKVVSFYVSGLGDELLSDPCDEMLNVFAGGRMIYDLCQQYGLTFDDLTQSFIKMDELYHQQNYMLSSYQYRKILDDILNADTSPAFYEPFSKKPWQIGNVFVITPNGGEISVIDDWVTMIVPPGAVSENVVVTFDNDPKVGASYRFMPFGLKFETPVELIIKYNEFTWYEPEKEHMIELKARQSNIVIDADINTQKNILRAKISELETFSFYFP